MLHGRQDDILSIIQSHGQKTSDVLDGVFINHKVKNNIEQCIGTNYVCLNSSWLIAKKKP
jgi:hypothetical protein